MPRQFDTFVRARIPGDLEEAFRLACAATGVTPSEALRALIAAWVRDVAESTNGEDRAHRGPAESDREGRPESAIR
ncbi:MAG: type II toxin-antitoxin system RelB/DinJ family antitoxin [Actinomycetota bacterium]